MKEIFKTIRQLIAKEDYASLHHLNIGKPSSFNWVTEVFEGINCREIPEENALIWTDGKESRAYTFVELSKRANQLLNVLRNAGLDQGDIIFSQMALLPENWITILTAIKGGFRLIPSATILGVHDIAYRFGRLMPKVAIADADNAGKIDAAEALSGNNVHIKIIVNGSRAGWTPFENILTASSQATPASTKPDDALFLFFTSGTTGMPKVVTQTHFSYPFGHLTTASWIGIRQGDIHYNIAQPGWAKFAWSSFFAPWNAGASVFVFHQSGKFNAAEQLRMIERHRVTTFCSPPTALRMLIQEDLGKYKFSLRQCVAAGEPLNPEVIEVWKKGTGLTIRDGYGQTETTCLVANLPGTVIKFGSMGKPTFLYDIIIADDGGRELPVHEEGTIAVRTNTTTPNGVFSEYFGDPEKKKEVFKFDLYYTGDKAYKDDDGYFWFVGRDDDVIKSSDYRVGPFEVESVLLEHESVLESAVVGSPHPIKGFEIKAFIIVHPNYAPSKGLADEIFAFARKNIAPYKSPRIIEFVPELPKTISGKIRRVELRAREAENKAKKMVIENEFVYSS